MMKDFEIPQTKPEEWLALLKPYQRGPIDNFLAQKLSLEQAAEKWLVATGSSNLVQFGGVHDTKPFWENFKAEFKRFICDDTAYVDQKSAFTRLGVKTRIAIVSTISTAIATQLGMIAALLVPAVVLMLMTVAEMGKNAYCKI